jgi:geranylgeranyl diphosphate synthase type II
MSISSSATLALPRFHLRRNTFFAHGHAQPKLKLKLKRDGEGIGMGRATTSSGKAPPLRCSSPSYVTDTPKGEGEGEGFDLRRYWNSVRKEMEAELEKSVPLRYPEKIHVSMRYSVLAEKAKRGPPMMCIAACEAVGGSKQQALPTACALEMVHTASLIHDDLPCMDDDPIRRGQPSNHTVFGVDMAVLAGDALFPLGFEYIVSSTSDVPPDRIVKVIAQIAKTVGSQGMVAGQYMDLGSTGNNKFDPSLVEFIHERKFGIMAECSAVTGGIIGGATDEEVERLRNYGRSVGVLYQIADDILEEEALLEGNGVIRKNKTSYPRAYGLEKAREIAETLRSNAKMELSGFDRGKSAPLYSFVDYAIDRSFDV